MPINHYSINKSITGIARFLSTAFSPMLMPTYGAFLVLWVSVLCVAPYGKRIAVLLVCMGITCILPLIFMSVLRHLKLVNHLHVVEQEKRHLPYIFVTVCDLLAAWYLAYFHNPRWFVMFMAGAALTVLVIALINIKWKISAHMAGIGGVVALIYQLHAQGLSAFNLFWLLCITILLGGALGSARLILKRHTLLEVLAGAVVGFACVNLIMKYLG